METEHNETVVEKAVAFVKDMFGIQPEPVHDVDPVPDFPDTAPEVTAENAMRLDPNAFLVDPAGQITPGSYVAPMDNMEPRDETDIERLRRQVDEPRQKGALELNAESARAEENG
jgi:hypothetical protein